LADLSGDAFIIGRCLLDVVPERAALADWIPELETDFSLGVPRTSMLGGILRFLPDAETAAFLHRVMSRDPILRPPRASGLQRRMPGGCFMIAGDSPAP